MKNRLGQRQIDLLQQVYMTIIMGCVLLLCSCHNSSTPRPHAYFRIDAYPAHYTPTRLGSISLHINDSAKRIIPNANTDEGVYWLNIVYPRYNATLYLSYIPLNKNLNHLMAESIELVYRQNVNTEQVEAIAYEDYENHLYATLFTLSAGSATPIQFIATDSTRYLLRGALYYDTPVKSDSVAPSLQYLENDIIHLIESISPISQ
ncbi:MAG: hypothetical protein IKJ79_02075 [Bacteroidaceae bacterium]|nr:hypothetical protein [Bacteroidaceae bacterium]